jgi:hypothetical protein
MLGNSASHRVHLHGFEVVFVMSAMAPPLQKVCIKNGYEDEIIFPFVPMSFGEFLRVSVSFWSFWEFGPRLCQENLPLQYVKNGKLQHIP